MEKKKVGKLFIIGTLAIMFVALTSFLDTLDVFYILSMFVISIFQTYIIRTYLIEKKEDGS